MKSLAPLALVLGTLGLSAVAGCLPERAEAERLTARKGPTLAPATADALILQTVLIEQSIGDPFLDADLWQVAASAVSGEQKALLAENGLRACVVRGHAPPRFLELLTSEQSTVNPQMLTFSNRKQEIIPTNGPLESSAFQVVRTLGVEPAKFSLRQAGFGWQVRPEVMDVGLVKLTCEPHVQHGDRQEWLRPSGDGTQFTLRGEHPVIRFSELAVTAIVGPQDFLVIGGVAEPTEHLGCAAFRLDANGQSRQRVLVLRAVKRSSEATMNHGGKEAATLVSAAARSK